ncbi:hypothetical protein ES705_27141 [subsurface metagenome]|jgi:hypothetical protein
MALIKGKSLNTKKQAVDFLLKDRHLLIRPEVVEWFSHARIHFSESELEEKSEEVVGKQVRKGFSRKAEWEKSKYYIVGPYYKFVTSQHPYFYDFTLNLYLVASIEVWPVDDEYSVNCVVIELIKKDVEKFKLPLDFLEAISQGDLSQFEQRGRDNQGYFTWHIPSMSQDIKLHGVLLKSLEDAFLGKPLGPALVYYGLASWEEGRRAEQSLSLMPSPTTSALVSKKAPICTREEVEEALTGGKLGIRARDAKKALDDVFNPSLSWEENVRQCIQYLGRAT